MRATEYFLGVCGGVVLTAIGTGALDLQETDARKTTTVEAERIVLKDATGRVRAEFGVKESGRVQLTVFNERGQARSYFGLTPASAVLGVDCDPGLLGQLAFGEPVRPDAKRMFLELVDEKLLLYARGVAPRLEINTRADRETGFVLRASDGKVLFSAP